MKTIDIRFLENELWDIIDTQMGDWIFHEPWRDYLDETVIITQIRDAIF